MNARRILVSIFAILALTFQTAFTCPLANHCDSPPRNRGSCPKAAMHCHRMGGTMPEKSPDKPQKPGNPQDCSMCALQQGASQDRSSLAVYDQTAIVATDVLSVHIPVLIHEAAVNQPSPQLFSIDRPPDLPRGPPSF